LLSASRDRQLGVFKLNEEGLYEKFWIGQVHSRLLFCVEITYDCKYIITGSRDKSIKIFALDDKTVTQSCSKKFKSGVTAVEFSKDMITESENSKLSIKRGYLFWVGLETGEIILCGFDLDSNTVIEIASIDKLSGHSKHINRIRQQRGCKNDLNRNKLTIATCSDDYSTRIYSFDSK